MDELEFNALTSLATSFSRDFESCFLSSDNRVNFDYVDSNAELFYSRYSSLVNAFYDGGGAERTSGVGGDCGDKRSRVIFVSIFFTWLRVKLFSLRCAWMRDAFFPFYDQEEYDLHFWTSLLDR